MTTFAVVHETHDHSWASFYLNIFHIDMKRLFAIILCLISIASAIMADETKYSSDDITLRANQMACESQRNTILAYKQICEDLSRDTVYAKLLVDYSSSCYLIDDFETAIEALNDAAIIYKTVYGENHLNYAKAIYDLAGCYSKQGDCALAIQYGRVAVDKVRIVLGPEHPNYAMALNNLAGYYFDQRNYDEAVSFYTMAKNIFKNVLGEDHPIYSSSLQKLANCYYHLKQYEESIRLCSEALYIQEQILEDPDSVECLKNLAISYEKLGNIDDAVNYYQRAADSTKDIFGRQSSEYAESLNDLADYYSKIYDYEKAIQLGEEILEITKEHSGKECLDYTSYLNNLAVYYSHVGKFEEAIQLGKESIDIITKVSGIENSDYAITLSNLAYVYFKYGDFSQAIKLGRECEEITKIVYGKEHSLYIMALTRLAEYYSTIGNYDEAIRLGKEAVNLAKNALSIDQPAYALSLHMLSWCYSRAGNFDDAIRLGSEAVVIKGNDMKDTNYASFLNSLAFYYSELGDYNTAISLGKEAMDITKYYLGEENQEYAAALNSLALFYSNNGDYYEAIRLGRNALEIRKKVLGVEHSYTSTTLMNLSIFHCQIGDYEEAIRLGKEAMEMLKNNLGEESPDYATSSHNLASAYSSLGNFSEAIRLEKNALNIRQKVLGMEHPYTIGNLLDLALCYSDSKNYEKAVPLIQESLPLVHKNVLNTFSWLTANERLLYWNKYSNYLNYLIPTAIIHSEIPDATSILFDNTALFAKGLLLSTELEMSKLIQESGDDEALQMYSILRENRQILNMQYSKPIADRHIDCDSLERVSSAIERQLISRVKDFGDYTRNLSISWKDVQKKLNDSDAAIEFISFPENDSTTVYAALSLCKNDINPVLTLLTTDLELIKASGDDRTYLTSMVDSLIWRPLLPRLEGKTHVYFSASGLLHNIGIEYLPSMEGKDCHRLSSTRELVTHQHSSSINSATLFGYIDYNATYSSIDSKTDNSAKYSNSPLNINYAQSSEQTRTEVKGSIATNDGNDLLATSDSPSSLEYDIQLPEASKNRGGFDYRSMRYEVDSLPGSRVEVQTISALLDSLDVAYVPLMTNQASEESFKALSGQRKSLIHISTHGFYYDEDEAENKAEHMRMILMGENRPANIEDQSLLRCGLCFAGANQTFKGESQPADGQDDGILNALEIAQTDLRGLDLVVLSACQTALGDVSQGEGVFGLQRGFKKAGAQSILMSLWDVDDEVTQQLMTEFYRDWTSGMTKTSALKSAQSKIKAKYPDPRHWAAFILLDALD